MSTPTCKSCGAPLLWAVTVNGKNVPLDARPEKRYVLQTPAGTIIATAAAGEVAGGGGLRAFVVDTFTGHHVTCPDAARFRRPR